MKIAIVTDSSCGIEDTSKIKDLYVVPLMITTEDGKQIKDDQNLSKDNFYQLADKQALKTSQTVPADMLGKWDELLKEYDQIVVALLSKGLSGQFNTFSMFAKEPEYEGKVAVIDTNGVSIILEHEIQEIAKLIAEGKDAWEIKKELDDTNGGFITYIIPKSLKTLVRGGRISPAAATMAKLLKITPILKYNGAIDKEGKTRTFKNAVNEAIEKIISQTDNVKSIDMSYSRMDDATLDLIKSIIKSHGLEIGLESELPNVITCHTGRETVALAAWLK